MIWARAILLAVLVAFQPAPAASHVQCGIFDNMDRWLLTVFDEVPTGDTWTVAERTFRYYLNATTGTWSIVATFVVGHNVLNGNKVIGACLVMTGGGKPGQEL